MKFTLSWLKDHLDTDAALERILDAMTMAGLEVEHWDDPAARLAPFSVARVASVAPHPNADRLRLCQVETVDGLKEIVCGAPNARAGLTTVYAPLGACIPASGIVLEPRAVRGIVSNGMLCSGAELGVSEESDGILELSGDWAVGAPAAAALGQSDAMIDFEVTPNRPDWLGVAGIARELAAAGLGRLKPQNVPAVAGQFDCPVPVAVDGSGLCPFFAGRLIRGVRNGPSPDWLQARLRAVGLRPINALVDITNFVALDRARPLHVYDANRLRGGVRAVASSGGETFVALDGREVRLETGMCAIADDSGVIGLGGIMGGRSTGCELETIDVFVESALFQPLSIFQTGRATGIASDARYRFERGVDPGFVRDGLELATRMILDICGGAPSHVACAGAVPPPPPPVAFDWGETRRLTGLDVPAAAQAEILKALGFSVDGAIVTPPTWRADVKESADLVEDVARIAGFDRLPAAALPPVPGRREPLATPMQNRVRLARRALAARGWMEAVTWSFASEAHCRLFGAPQGGNGLVLANPIASDLDCMRPSALIHLLLAAQRNADRGHGQLALFEAGPIYLDDSPQGQRTVLAGVARGQRRHWQGNGGPDVFSVKADLMAVLEALGAPVAGLSVEAGARDWWHPGQSGSLRLGPKNLLAEFGALHPRTLNAMGVDGPVYGFELHLDALPEAKARAGKTRPPLDASALMPLKRDFAFLIAADRPAGPLVKAVKAADRALIGEVSVFDLYQGPGVPEGERSLALEVTIQPVERTLTDAEIDGLSARIVAAAAKQGARLRT